MKKKNLEKAVILGLILSTGIYGTAWASQSNPWSDANIDKENNTITLNGYVYIPDNYDYYLTLPTYSKIIINSGLTNGLYMAGRDYGLIAPDTDLDITVYGEEIPEHHTGTSGIHLSSQNFEIKNYTAKIHSPQSDALNITDTFDFNSTDEIFNINAVIHGFLDAEVDYGSGIRANANAGENSDGMTTSINVKGDTKIVINSALVEASYDDIHRYKPGTETELVNYEMIAKYKPAAVYAGDSMVNFSFEGKRTEVEFGGQTMEHPKAGYGDYGSDTVGYGIVNLDNNVEITTKGYGIYAGKNGEINLNNNANTKLEITGKGTDAVGIAAINSNLIFDNYVKIIDAELAAFDIYIPVEVSEEATLDTSANEYGSVVTMNGENNTITMENGGKALYADAKNKADGDKDVIIQSGASGIGTLDVKGDIVAANSGKINLQVNDWADITGDVEATNSAEINFTLQPEAMMIVSDMDNNIIGNSGASALSLAKNSDVAGGNVQAANGATINFKLGNGAYFEGRVDDYKDADNTNWNTIDRNLFDSAFVTENTDENGKMTSGKVNMELGNGAVWNVTEQSWVTNLNGNGTVVLVGEVNQNDENLDSNIYTEGTGGYAVHIGKLEGNNTFVVNLNPDNYAGSDMIYIYDGSSAGTQNLRINNEQEVLNALQNDGDRIRFATAAKTATTEGAGFGDDYVVRGRGVINSGFSIDYVDYATDTDNGNYNGTAGAVKPGDEYIENTYGAVADSQNLYLVRDSSKDAGLSDSGKTVINMSRANYKNAVYMDRLNKRLGEARYFNNEEEQGMWVRLRHDRIGLDGEFRSQNTMYEMGYDVKQDCDNGERRVGMAIDYMDGSTSYSNIIGEGETKRYGLWLYDTWLGDKGHYTDYVLKWGHLDNDFDIRDKDSLVDITGDYSNNVFSASAEYGKKNDMGGGWYFEPQAQLQFARVTGADYVTSQDSKVSLDGINSLIGRAGFRLGRDLNENSTVYVKADLLHEFLGDQDITATDITGTLREEYENEGTWYDVGFGFATALGKSSYAFMDFEKSFGNDNDETYQINAGVQWTF